MHPVIFVSSWGFGIGCLLCNYPVKGVSLVQLYVNSDIFTR